MEQSRKETINNRGKNISLLGITIVTCTKRPDAIYNILENYKRQEQRKKELIIILHNNSMDKNKWKEAAHGYTNVRIFRIDENRTLGECLNIGAKHANFEFVAKFDDDDYYGPKYLVDAFKVLKEVKADVIGKATSYVYFEKDGILALRNPGNESRYVQHVDGPSIIFKKSVLRRVKFRNISLGEDYWFCKDCINQGIKIYSTNRFQHVYMRHANVNNHTWTIEDEKLLEWCEIVAKGKIDFEKYINPLV